MDSIRDVVYISANQFKYMYALLEKFQTDKHLLKTFEDQYDALKTLDLLPTLSVGERPSVAVYTLDIAVFKVAYNKIDTNELNKFRRFYFG